MVSQYAHLVEQASRAFSNWLPASLEKADLVQSGMIALMDAIVRYNPNLNPNTRFEAFAWHRIRGAMIDEIRRHVPGPRRAQKRGEAPQMVDVADVAFELSCTNPGPEQIAIEQDQMTRLAAAIEQLPERERQILALYYDEDLNLKEIGQALGLTESRISQLRSQALKCLSAKVNH